MGVIISFSLSLSLTGKQTRGAKLLVFSDSDIPLTKEAFNGRAQVNVGLTVIDVLSDGFSRVPYDCIKGVFKSAGDAKPLTEKRPWSEDPERQFNEVTCYPYTIAEGPSAAQKKGERVEDYKWSIFPGDYEHHFFVKSNCFSLLVCTCLQEWC